MYCTEGDTSWYKRQSDEKVTTRKEPKDATLAPTRSSLLNLGQIEVKQFIEEVQELSPTKKVSSIHHACFRKSMQCCQWQRVKTKQVDSREIKSFLPTAASPELIINLSSALDTGDRENARYVPTVQQSDDEWSDTLILHVSCLWVHLAIRGFEF
jgi:hypothetical protein